ncbi:MAG: glucose-1-phosphate adenylyltransferase subunit GlgD [Mogibacterium sp.]|nr:glucose-1-phosphate adenylyltransferase subunit GlgD [Mogibacterium sp.]
MNAFGLIFADSYDVALDKLTEHRTLAAVPFGGRYRVIDFTLSNLVNAGIRNIGIITTQKYDSLMNHVRAGAEWDLNRKSTGLTFLPPYSSEDIRKSVYENRLEAMQSNMAYIRNMREEYVIMTSCNYIGNVDFDKMLEYHISTGADITGLYTKNPHNKAGDIPSTEFIVEKDQTVSDVRITSDPAEGACIAANAYILKRQDLLEVLEHTIRENKTSFRRHVLIEAIERGYKFMAYEAPETLLFLDTISSYMKSNFELLDRGMRDELFYNEYRPVITKVKDSAPTKYASEAKATNSIIADGAVIEGEVRNSIIFRGVRVKKGAVVENCVLMQDVLVGEAARLNYAVLDKNVTINDCRMLSGYITHPFYVGHGENI